MMNKAIIRIIIFGLFFLFTACVQQNLDSIVQDASTQISAQGGEGIQLQHEGIGPLEITPDPGGGESAAAPSADKIEGNISSSGKQSTSGSKNVEPGYVDSVAPSSLTLNQEESLTVVWLTYFDQAFSFSIIYPQTYTILPEFANSVIDDPVKVHQVRFQDIQLATGDSAEFELPTFTIEVFELGDQTLEAFIAQIEPGGHKEEYQVNNLNGFRVYYNQLIAPNEFYFFSANGYVYKLTPLGSYSQEMLHSFNIQ
jgi:hypothetical protein